MACTVLTKCINSLVRHDGLIVTNTLNINDDHISKPTVHVRSGTVWNVVAVSFKEKMPLQRTYSTCASQFTTNYDTCFGTILLDSSGEVTCLISFIKFLSRRTDNNDICGGRVRNRLKNTDYDSTAREATGTLVCIQSDFLPQRVVPATRPCLSQPF